MQYTFLLIPLTKMRHVALLQGAAVMSAAKDILLEQESLGNLKTYRTLNLPSMNVPVSQGSSGNDLNRVFSENVL